MRPSCIWTTGAAPAPQQPAAPDPSPPAPAFSPGADIWGVEDTRTPEPETMPPPSAQPLPGRAQGSTPRPPASPDATVTTPDPAPPDPPPTQGPDAERVLDAIATAAGLPEGSLSRGNPIETATEIGRALHTLGDELSSLLQARAVARRSVRSGQVTMIGREDNNPLKFMPSPDQALSAMFGPPAPAFSGAARRSARPSAMSNATNTPPMPPSSPRWRGCSTISRRKPSRRG